MVKPFNFAPMLGCNVTDCWARAVWQSAKTVMDVPNELNIVCFMFADFANEWGLFPINPKKKTHYRHQVNVHQAYGHQVYGVIRTSNKKK